MTAWRLVAPMFDYRTSRTHPERIPLAQNVILQGTPDWAKSDDVVNAAKSLSGWRMEDLKIAQFCLMLDGEATAIETAEHAVLLAGLAMWLARGASVGASAILWFERTDDAYSLRVVKTFDPIRPHDVDQATMLDDADYIKSARLHEALLGLNTDGLLYTTAKILDRALCQTWWPARYLFMWVAMESLFGPDDAQEVAHRIATRCAFLLETDWRARQERFRVVKRGYRWRCKVAHGLKLANLNPVESAQVLYQVEELLRVSLQRILMTPVLQQAFDGDSRESFLNNLTLGASAT